MTQFGDAVARDWDPKGADLREAEETAWEEAERLLRLREAAAPWLDDADGQGVDYE